MLERTFTSVAVSRTTSAKRSGVHAALPERGRLSRFPGPLSAVPTDVAHWNFGQPTVFAPGDPVARAPRPVPRKLVTLASRAAAPGGRFFRGRDGSASLLPGMRGP